MASAKTGVLIRCQTAANPVSQLSIGARFLILVFRPL
jgi:hypothetical protein